MKRVLKELDLVGIENSRIGDETTRGISGGQKRRVTVGIELLNDPSLFFYFYIHTHIYQLIFFFFFKKVSSF